MRVALAAAATAVIAVAMLPAVVTASIVECEEINPRRDICEVVLTDERGERNALRVRVAGETVTFGDRVALRPDGSAPS